MAESEDNGELNGEDNGEGSFVDSANEDVPTTPDLMASPEYIRNGWFSIYKHTHTHARTHARTHTNTHTHTHTHARTHAHTHAHTPGCKTR